MSKNKTQLAMTARNYTTAVLSRGGPTKVAAALGVHAASVRKRMRGTYPVLQEAAMALQQVPLTKKDAK